MGQKIFAIVVAVIVGMISIGLIHFFLPALYPLPEGLDPMNNPDDQISFIQGMPMNAKMLIIFAHAFGAFVAALLAALLSNTYKRRTGLLAGAIILAAALGNFIATSHNIGFGIIDLSITALLAFIGASLASRGEVIIEK